MKKEETAVIATSDESAINAAADNRNEEKTSYVITAEDKDSFCKIAHYIAFYGLNMSAFPEKLAFVVECDEDDDINVITQRIGDLFQNAIVNVRPIDEIVKTPEEVINLEYADTNTLRGVCRLLLNRQRNTLDEGYRLQDEHDETKSELEDCKRELEECRKKLESGKKGQDYYYKRFREEEDRAGQLRKLLGSIAVIADMGSKEPEL